jgi:predicted dehydrogenase
MSATASAADVRVGIVGLDTSHATEFTARLNDPASPNYVTGARVVAALPEFSPDLPMSKDRVEGFTATVRDEFGVQIVKDAPELLAACDAVMVLSLDGRKHPDQVRRLLAAKKPIFLDKPVAASLKDAVAIYTEAKRAGTPLFSASALRWYPGVVEVANAKLEGISGATSYGPAPTQPQHPSLFFYGIHPTEALFTVLGEGCTHVTATQGTSAMVVTGKWKDGRLGTLYAMQTWPADYQVTLFGKDKIVQQSKGGDYSPLVREIVSFFQTGKAPVTPEQTLEIYAFMAAADESADRGGKPVSIAEMLSDAGWK